VKPYKVKAFVDIPRAGRGQPVVIVAVMENGVQRVMTEVTLATIIVSMEYSGRHDNV